MKGDHDLTPVEAWERRPGGAWQCVKSGSRDTVVKWMKRQVHYGLSSRFARFDTVEYVVLKVGDYPDATTVPDGVAG